jgi:hypothetical protein
MSHQFYSENDVTSNWRTGSGQHGRFSVTVRPKGLAII